ncbi:MAG: sodium-dependent transporter [Cytophagales bacterium]
MESSSDHKKQSGFSSSIGFLFAAIAASVGLSNIWRFPAETAQYGGGCYVFVYLIFTLLVGFPLILGELALGRKNQQGLFSVYKNEGRWSCLGPLSALVCFLIFCFYNVVAGWVVGYLWKTGTGELFEYGDGGTANSFDSCWETLRAHWQMNLITTFVMLAAAMGINYAGVNEGIEKCSKVLMPIFAVMLIGLIGYSVTLSGAGNGLKKYLYPDLSELSLEGVARALAQSFMSLSAGLGTMVTYGCYVGRGTNLRKSAMVITMGDTLIALMAGFFIFAFLGFLDFSSGGNGENMKMPKDGTGLAFTTLPEIFKGMSSGLGIILAGAFFLLLIFAAITSSISLFEVPTRYLEARYKIKHSYAILLTGGLSFAISILCILSDGNFGWLGKIKLHERFQDVVTCILMPLTALITNLFLAYRCKLGSLLAVSNNGEDNNKYFATYMKWTLRYISPCIIFVSLLVSTYEFICFK